MKDFDVQSFRTMFYVDNDDDLGIRFNLMNQEISYRTMFFILLLAKLMGASQVLSKELVQRLGNIFPFG